VGMERMLTNLVIATTLARKKSLMSEGIDGGAGKVLLGQNTGALFCWMNFFFVTSMYLEILRFNQ